MGVEIRMMDGFLCEVLDKVWMI